MTAVDAGPTGRLRARDEEAALEQLHELGCTDGLPVVLPTPSRVERMALASGLDPDLSLGEMGPAMGVCTVEKLAACAVMAGCLPDHFPVVVAAVSALMDPAFDLTEMQATTYATAPLVVVNGPARHDCGGISGGFGALGPGHRANAAIGRAVRLAMINVGGGRAGSSDMTLLGHGGKFTACLAEDEEHSPLPPLHEDLGYAAESSTVTVLGTEGPHSVMAVTDADDPEAAERLLRSLASGFAHVATNNAVLRGGQGLVALNPDHAAVLVNAGMDRAAIAAAIAERAVVPGRALLDAAGSLGRLDPDREYRCFASADDVLVIVAGGGGLYSAVFPTWCAGPHRSRAVTVEIALDQSCVIPGAPV